MTAALREGNKVSIVVVNWNGLRLLDDCLTALASQTYRNYEIIFVDNGSSDDSVGVVRKQFPHVKVVELSENRGFTGGNVAGLQIAQGEFVALINNDARAGNRWLENLVQPMFRDPTVGICASKLLVDQTDQIDSAGDGITSAGVGFKRGCYQHKSRYESNEGAFGACAAAALYRRSMLDEIGFLDEDFFLNDEDTDLSFRAQLFGWKCVYVPSALVYHKVNASIGRLSDAAVYYHTRNLEFIWVKNMPAALMVRFAHHKLIQEIGAFCYLCLRHGKWLAFFRAKRDALRMIPKMWKKRREIQRRRKISSHQLKKAVTSIFARELLRQKVHQFIYG